MTGIFNVRVYGLVLNENKEVLLSDEYVYGQYIAKFPGGGLQFGEGTVECLHREFKEELNLKIDAVTHFYTTDFFQASFLNPKQQVISIYYLVSLKQPEKLKVSGKAFDFDEVKEGMQSIRWLQLKESREEELTFPIDKKVLQLLKDHFTS
jgi:8-oxo-dGTP diphosphatase